MPDEICAKCRRQGNVLRYCGPQARQLSCLDQPGEEHIHVICDRCGYLIRKRDCDDAP